MSILAPESKDRKKDPLSYVKSGIARFGERLFENFSYPKENSEEYCRLKNFLGEHFEEYEKHWTIKKAKVANEMTKLQIINFKNILTDRENVLKSLEKGKDKNHGIVKKSKTAKTMTESKKNILIDLEDILIGQIASIGNHIKIKVAKKAYEDILKGKDIDKWDDNDIETAGKLKEIGMEIRLTDRKHMRHWNFKKRERLKKWKNNHGGELLYPYNKPFGGGPANRSLTPGDYHLFGTDFK